MKKKLNHNKLVEDDLKVTIEKPIDDPKVRNKIAAEVKKKFWRTRVVLILTLLTIAILMFVLLTLIPMK